MARLIGRLRQRYGAVLTLLCLPFALFGLLALDDGGGDGGGDGDGDGDAGSGDGDDDDKDLSDAGKRALSRERAARREADKARKAADRKAKDLEDRLAKLETDGKSDSDKAIEKARREAEEAARKEERTKSDQRIVRAGVREVAATKLHDPADALVHLDIEDFSVDDDGEVDRKAITKAVDDLLKLKPYLAKDKGKPGGADGGARSNDDGKDQDVSPSQRLRRAYATTKKT